MNIIYTQSFETSFIQAFKINIDNPENQPIKSITITIKTDDDNLTYQSNNVLYDIDYITFPDINDVLINQVNQVNQGILYITILSTSSLINLSYAILV